MATVVVVEEVAVVVTTGHKEVVALTAVGEDQVDTGVLVDPTEVVGEEGVTVEAEVGLVIIQIILGRQQNYSFHLTSSCK